MFYSISGDDKLTLYERNLLKKLKPCELCTVEGSVLAICWQGNLVAWASHLGVRVYDLSEKCSLGLMKWEVPAQARLENFRCHLRWSNSNTLLIGWVDTIRICVIRKRNAIEASSSNLPGFVVDPGARYYDAACHYSNMFKLILQSLHFKPHFMFVDWRRWQPASWLSWAIARIAVPTIKLYGQCCASLNTK